MRQGKCGRFLNAIAGYAQFEYANEEFADLFALSSLVISRAELTRSASFALRKPNILIPLLAAASCGDQILNANSFRSQGFSYVLEEEELTNTTLLEAIDHVFHKKDAYIDAMDTARSQTPSRRSWD